MSESGNLKSILNRTFWTVWYPISLLMAASDLISLLNSWDQDWVEWSKVFREFFELVAYVRDSLLFPIEWPLEWIFNFEFPLWLKTYLFFLIYFWNMVLR